MQLVSVVLAFLAAWCCLSAVIVLSAGSEPGGEQAPPWRGFDRWAWIYGGAALALTMLAWKTASWGAVAGGAIAG